MCHLHLKALMLLSVCLQRVGKYNQSISVMRDALSKIQYLLHFYHSEEGQSVRELKRDKVVNKLYKLLILALMNICRCLELKSEYLYCEVSARVALYTAEDALEDGCPFKQVVQVYYNFIKEKVAQSSSSIKQPSRQKSSLRTSSSETAGRRHRSIKNSSCKHNTTRSHTIKESSMLTLLSF